MPESCGSTAASWLQVVPWILVVIGWFLVNRQSNRRELRKECRAAVDASRKSIFEIANKAVDYYVNGNGAVEVELTDMLDLLEMELERVDLLDPKHPLMTHFLAFKRSITGGDFQSRTFVRILRTAPRIQGIVLSRNLLTLTLEQEFRRRFYDVGAWSPFRGLR